MKYLTQRQLREILTDSLALQSAEFRLEAWDKRISGSVISDSFKGMDDVKRQRSIWNALDERLGQDARRLVGMLLAFTPDEWNIKLEGHGRVGRQSRAHTAK